MQRFGRQVQKLRKTGHFTLPRASLFIGVFALVGVAMLLATRAVTPVNNVIEPEDGYPVGNVRMDTDNTGTASGGKYATFFAATTTCPAGQTGTPPNCVPASSGIGQDTGCVFQKADQPMTQAFCDSFDAPHFGGTQTGDLSPLLWGVSRSVDWNPGSIVNGIVASHNLCAGGAAVLPPKDVQVCNGQVAESLNDGHGVVNLDMYPKQPFSFANRTGTVVFDLSADSDGTHGAWPEFLISSEPVPGIRRCVSCVDVTTDPPAHAFDQLGFSIDGCTAGPGGTTGVGVVTVSKAGVYNEYESGFRDCVTKGSRTAMNHFEVRVNTSMIEVWASDAGGKTLKKIASETIPGGLGFSQGLVWMNDAHYNARKAIEPCECGTEYDHTFFWDNLGFDGPKTYRDLGYDVPYANVPGGNSIGGDPETNLGYMIGSSKTFSIPNVSWVQTPTKVKLVFNAYSFGGSGYTASLNGHTAVATAFNGPGYGVATFAITFPTTDAVQGTNTVTINSNPSDGSASVANVSLIMVAGAPVP